MFFQNILRNLMDIRNLIKYQAICVSYPLHHRKNNSKFFFVKPKLCDLKRINDLLLKYVLNYTVLFIVIIVTFIYYAQFFLNGAYSELTHYRFVHISKLIKKHITFLKISQIYSSPNPYRMIDIFENFKEYDVFFKSILVYGQICRVDVVVIT